MPVSRSFLRRRVIAFIAAFAMVAVISGFTAHGFAAHGHQPDQDWAMHFTGVAGSAPKPAPIARPVLAAWLPPTAPPAVPRSPRRLRAHLPRGPPPQLHPAFFA